MKFDSQILALYLIADSCYDRLVERTEEALQGGVTFVQLRMKDEEGKAFFEMAVQMKALCDQYQIPLLSTHRQSATPLRLRKSFLIRLLWFLLQL